jgi:uncharacterized peroxidase-related enzyme
MRDWEEAELSSQDRALCAFAVQLTRAPESMDRSALEALRREGLSDEAIHDAAQVIAYFNYINRIADALGTDLDPGMPERPPWQR